MKTLHTNSSIDGLARGKAFIVRRESSREHISVGTIDYELKKFSSALLSVRDDLSSLEGDVFAAHLEMLEDPVLTEQVENHIRFDGMGAVEASYSACEELASMFNEIDDEYLRARVDDVRDVFGRLIAALTGCSDNPYKNVPDGSVIVANELLPSDTALMDFSKIRAFVTEKGSATSHVSIIARSQGIPALIGLKGCLEEINDGDELLVNGTLGTLVVNPDSESSIQFDALLAIGEKTSEMISAAAFGRAVSPDGKEILVYGNAGNIDEVRITIERGADGIGLFRSEFLYMQESSLPTEERQF
jgi:phosphotransferase system enzyme I (PtsI)